MTDHSSLDRSSPERQLPSHVLKELEASRLEILLLAVGVLVLVTQLAIFIWIGTRKHRYQDVETDMTPPGTWSPDRKDPIPYEPRLIRQTRQQVRSIMKRARSATLVSSIKKEAVPAAVRRKLAASGTAVNLRESEQTDGKAKACRSHRISRSLSDFGSVKGAVRPDSLSPEMRLTSHDDSNSFFGRGRTRIRASGPEHLARSPQPPFDRSSHER